jgi:hypothetical protein
MVSLHSLLCCTSTAAGRRATGVSQGVQGGGQAHLAVHLHMRFFSL